MATEIRKEPKELLVGDVFVFPDYDRKYHFKVKKFISGLSSSHTRFFAELTWANGNGKYYDYGPGFIEEFSFRNDRPWSLKVLKTSRHGCCSDCLGSLEWVSLALKCSQCGKIET